MKLHLYHNEDVLIDTHADTLHEALSAATAQISSTDKTEPGKPFIKGKLTIPNWSLTTSKKEDFKWKEVKQKL